MATLAEIRQQYPQYSDMSDADLASALHKKFYADMPVEDFNTKIGLKSAAAPAPAAPAKNALGYADDVVRSLASGATFGFADELAAKGNELIGSGSYGENVKKERERDEAIPPAIRIPGEIAGAVGSTFALGPAGLALAGRSLPFLASRAAQLPAAVKFGLLGGGEGALAGAGNAEEGKRLEGAVTGGLIGAPTGAVTPMVVRGVSRIAQGVKNAFTPEANVAADLQRAFMRDETTPAELMRRASELQTIRPGVAGLADAGGTSVRDVVERVAQTPGAGRAKLEPMMIARQQSQGERIANDLRHLTGTSRTAFQAVEEVTAARAKEATPLYQAAYQAGDRAIWSTELERLSSSPTIQQAMRGAVRVWRDNAIADGYGAMNPGALVDRGGQLSFLSGKVPVFPNLQFWDYTKQLVDQQASAAFKAGFNKKGATLAKLAEKLRTELDTMVPEYQPARSAWAGRTAFLDAVEEGRNIVSRVADPEEVIARFRSMSAAEQDAFRIGAVSRLIGEMGNDAAKLGDMTKYMRSPAMRAKIAAIMPTEEAAQGWTKRLNFEVGASELTGQALRNSATAKRLTMKEEAQSLVGDLIQDALSGSGTRSLLFKVIGAGPKWIRDTLRSRADRELADVLTNPARIQDLPDVLDRIRRQAIPPSGRTNAGVTVGTTALFQ